MIQTVSQNIWFFYALSSAIIWGFGYALSERVMGYKISPAFLLIVQNVLTLPIYLAIAHYTDTLKQSWSVFSTNITAGSLAVVFALSVATGNFLILTSISEKNATLANLIEITYPVFTFFFAWLLFKDMQLSWGAALGGLLIFSGITLIYFKG